MMLEAGLFVVLLGTMTVELELEAVL